MKPLGYYLNDISIEGAQGLQDLLQDLSSEDKLGVIEWLTHDLRDDIQAISERLTAAEEQQ